MKGSFSVSQTSPATVHFSINHAKKKWSMQTSLNWAKVKTLRALRIKDQIQFRAQVCYRSRRFQNIKVPIHMCTGIIKTTKSVVMTYRRYRRLAMEFKIDSRANSIKSDRAKIFPLKSNSKRHILINKKFSPL